MPTGLGKPDCLEYAEVCGTMDYGGAKKLLHMQKKRVGKPSAKVTHVAYLLKPPTRPRTRAFFLNADSNFLIVLRKNLILS